MNRSDRERDTEREREMNRHEPLAFDLLKSLVVLRTVRARWRWKGRLDCRPCRPFPRSATSSTPACDWMAQAVTDHART